MSIRLEYSVIAKCKPEHAWQKFEKLEEWPWWNHVIGKTQWLSGGRWQEGGRFMFEMLRPRHMTFKPVILKSAVPTQIAWVGKSFGLTGEHWCAGAFAQQLQPLCSGRPDGVAPVR